MDKKTKDICRNNPQDAACDVVQYAQELLNEEALAKPKMTVGKQPGLTKTTVEGVMEVSQK